MQQLHLVGFTTDSEQLILSAKKGAKSGSFVVPLDERLLEVLAEAVRRRNSEGSDQPLAAPRELLPPPPPAKRASLLSPREIQARLRAGRTITQVAREAAADEDWIAKFDPPVQAERERIVGRAREMVYAKPRRGISAEPLGLSVRWNLADRGIRLTDDEFDRCWSAYFVGDLNWGVTFEFVARGRRQTAEWEVDFENVELVARNRIASDLGYVESGRRRRVSLIPTAAEAASRAAAEVKATAAPKPAATRTASKTAKRTTKKTAKKAAKKTAKKGTKRAAKRTTKKAVKKTAARKATTTRKVSAKAPARKAAAKAVKKAGNKAVKKTAKKAAKKTAKRPGASKRTGRPRVVAATAVAAPRPPANRPAPANELARRRLELIGKQLPAARPSRPRPAPAPVRQRPSVVDAPKLDVEDLAPRPDAADDAKARREERRRARAERTASRPIALPSPSETARERPDGEQIVTIRAGRAGGTGDVVVPGGARPLRPALPAAEPGRRRRRDRTR